jgi:hypothetical protein
MTYDIESVFCTEYEYERQNFFDPPDDPLGGVQTG